MRNYDPNIEHSTITAPFPPRACVVQHLLFPHTTVYKNGKRMEAWEGGKGARCFDSAINFFPRPDWMSRERWDALYTTIVPDDGFIKTALSLLLSRLPKKSCTIAL